MLKNLIAKQLNDIAKKYGQDRKTQIISAVAEEEAAEEIEVDNSPVTLFFTKDGYFKKITPLSLRMSGEQKLKEGDEITQTTESTNAADLLFFSNKCQVYKSKTAEFGDGKASVMGDYIPSKLEFDEAENAIYMVETTDYSGYMAIEYKEADCIPPPAEDTAADCQVGFANPLPRWVTGQKPY